MKKKSCKIFAAGVNSILKKLFFITDSVLISESVCPEQAFSNELDRGLAKDKRLSSIRQTISDEEKEF
jgi:hypothetical protein